MIQSVVYMHVYVYMIHNTQCNTVLYNCTSTCTVLYTCSVGLPAYSLLRCILQDETEPAALDPRFIKISDIIIIE